MTTSMEETTKERPKKEELQIDWWSRLFERLSLKDLHEEARN